MIDITSIATLENRGPDVYAPITPFLTGPVPDNGAADVVVDAIAKGIPADFVADVVPPDPERHAVSPGSIARVPCVFAFEVGGGECFRAQESQSVKQI